MPVGVELDFCMSSHATPPRVICTAPPLPPTHKHPHTRSRAVGGAAARRVSPVGCRLPRGPDPRPSGVGPVYKSRAMYLYQTPKVNKIVFTLATKSPVRGRQQSTPFHLRVNTIPNTISLSLSNRYRYRLARRANRSRPPGVDRPQHPQDGCLTSLVALFGAHCPSPSQASHASHHSRPRARQLGMGRDRLLSFLEYFPRFEEFSIGESL